MNVAWSQVGMEIAKLGADWLWRVDSRGHIMEWTPCGMIDRTGREILPVPADYGHWDKYFFPNTQRRGHWVNMIRHIKSRTPFRNLRIDCKLPHLSVYGTLSLTGVPTFDGTGELTGYCGTAINMTGTSMTERKLSRISRHMGDLEVAVNASATVLMVINPCVIGFPITYITNSFTRMTGYDREDVMGQDISLLCGPATDPVAQMKMRDLMALRRTGVVELQLYRRNGDSFWAELSVMPSRDENSAMCSMVCSLRDISEERAYRQALIQRDRLERLGQMAGGLAHEINNLLQPAALYAEILNEEAAAGSIMEEGMQAIQGSIEQIRFIVQNTLRFSRQQPDQQQNDPLPLVPLLRDRIHYLRGLIPSSVSIVVSGLEDDQSLAFVNSTALTQVLSNLINNAVHAMKGQGALEIDLCHVQLDGLQRSENLPPGRYIEIKVRDNGHGMTVDVASRIFDPFFTTKAMGEGTGLGLPVVYGLVHDWAGSIAVESVVGQGTTFTFLIPLYEGQSVANLNKGVENEARITG